MKTNTLHICLATDDRFAEYCKICIHEIIIHKKQDTILFFYILGDKLSNSNMFDIFNSIPNVHVSVIFCNTSDVVNPNELYYSRYNNHTTFLRYLIPELKEFKDLDRILYLDSDLVIKKDLVDLYNTDLGDNVLGGVRWVFGIFMNVHNYTNAGVLLMDLNKLRQMYFTRKCISNTLSVWMNTSELPNHDESVINAVCFGKIKFISPIYNFLYSEVLKNSPHMKDVSIWNSRYKLNYSSFLDLLKDAAILHVLGDVPNLERKCILINNLYKKLRERLYNFEQTKNIVFINPDDDLNIFTESL